MSIESRQGCESREAQAWRGFGMVIYCRDQNYTNKYCEECNVQIMDSTV